MSNNTLTFTDFLSVNDIIVTAYCPTYGFCIDFESDPNYPLRKFRNEILDRVYNEALSYYGMFGGTHAEIRAKFAVVDAKCLFDDIVNDALASGTWMTVGQLWNLETYKVVNMANAVRKN